MSRKTQYFSFYILFFFICALTASCAVNPVSGDRELMLLSESGERDLGRKTDKEVIRQYGIYEDAKLKKYVADLGKSLAGLSHRPDLPYEFKIIDSPVINAFAVPGGYVYLTRGILAHMNSEAELAGIIGHELGHITARHSAKQYSRAQIAQIGIGLGAVLSETFRDFAGVAQAGVGMLFLKFSRDNERQADDLGVEYSSRAGYNADEMAGFFETLERKNPGSGSGGLPGWFSTHPSPDERQQTVKQRSSQWRDKLDIQSPKVNHNKYLWKIDGLVFGEDPRQGYEKEGAFYHPTLLFQFPVPSQWELQNSPSQVVMISPEKNAVILFSLASEGSPGKAADAFVSKAQARILSSSSGKVNGNPAYSLISYVGQGDSLLQVLSYFIEKSGKTFVFHGYCRPSAFKSQEYLFRNTMEGFKKPKHPGKLRVEPDRVKIQRVRRPTTVRGALKKFGVLEKDMEGVAVLNGKYLDDRLPDGALIKVVKKGDR